MDYRRLKPFLSFNAVRPKAASNEILIYGPISDFECFGDEVTPMSILDQLAALEGADEITVRINSPGGFITESTAIYNALRRHPANVKIQIDGLAASGASLIAMAGDKISIAANATMMIHEAWVMAMGGADDLLKAAEVLEKLNAGMLATYAARTGNSEDDVRAMLAAETWFTAEEAKAKGFADKIVELKTKPEARADLSVYANVPDWVKDQYQMEPPPKAIQDESPEKAEAQGRDPAMLRKKVEIEQVAV